MSDRSGVDLYVGLTHEDAKQYRDELWRRDMDLSTRRSAVVSASQPQKVEGMRIERVFFSPQVERIRQTFEIIHCSLLEMRGTSR